MGNIIKITKPNVNGILLPEEGYTFWDDSKDEFVTIEKFDHEMLRDKFYQSGCSNGERFGCTSYISGTLAYAMQRYRAESIAAKNNGSGGVITGGNIFSYSSVKIKIIQHKMIEVDSYKELIEIVNNFKVKLVGGIYADRYIFETEDVKFYMSFIKEEKTGVTVTAHEAA